MNKKPASEIVEANVRNSDISPFPFTEQEKALAERLGIEINSSIDARLNFAVGKTNQALRLVVEAGLIFLSVKAELKHGEFLPALEALGVNPKRAHESMVFARAAAALPEDKREALMLVPKSKALVLAGADYEVLEQMLEDGDVSDLDALSVRELRHRIRALEAHNTDLSVQVGTAEAERDGAIKKLNKRNQRDDDEGVPVVVADLRAELAALVKKAELAITSLYPLGVDIVGLSSNSQAHEWVEPTLRLGLSGLLALRELIDGSIKSFSEAMGEQVRRLQSGPDALAFLDDAEIKAVAEEWMRLTATHQHEAALREYERGQAKPKGKGRPAKAPEAPKAKG